MTRGKSLLSLCTLWGALGVGCGDQGVYVMFERYELVGEKRVFAGSGCLLAIEHGLGSSGSSGGTSGLAGPEADLVISEHNAGNAFVVQVSSGGEELAQRRYSEKTLLSGKRDQFTVTTHSGREFELTYWGGDDCDPPPSPEQ